MPTTDAQRDRLMARRTELTARLGALESDLDAPLPADMEEQAIELEDDEVLERLGTSGLAELRAIDAALGRIASGTYGICTGCGEAIAPARLAAVPQAARCVRCA